MAEGERLAVEGELIVLAGRIRLGHKIARRDLAAGEKVLKYGAPIGSMTEPARRGAHVHVRNLKSDYIPTYVIENQADFEKRRIP